MKIDILMATYNGEKYLREQLDSILNQSFKDFILFISDDCSKDTTRQILEEYKFDIIIDITSYTKNDVKSILDSLGDTKNLVEKYILLML